jgi:hypothetical protein
VLAVFIKIETHNSIELTSLIQYKLFNFIYTYISYSLTIKYIKCHHAMRSHNNIHMCPVPYQSHIHTDTSNIKIIQNYSSSSYNHMLCYACSCSFSSFRAIFIVRLTLWYETCHHYREPSPHFSFTYKANPAVGYLSSLLGAITPFLVMDEASLAVGNLSLLTRVITLFLFMQEASPAVGYLKILPGAVTPFLVMHRPTLR